MNKNFSSEIGLTDEVVGMLCGIFRATAEIDEVVVFGSRAKGNFRNGSDIDLAVKGEHMNFDRMLDLSASIDYLGLLYTIDIQNYDRIKSVELKNHVDSIGKLLWSRESDMTNNDNGLLIIEAIEKMQQLQFIYNDKLRIVEPQFYGVGKKGIEQLRGYQINETPRLEKLFDVAKMETLELLPIHFDKPGPNYNRNDSAFVKEIRKLK